MINRLKLIIVLILTSFLSKAQPIDTKSFFPNKTHNELWKTFINLNPSQLEQANQVLEQSISNLSQGISPQENLMIASNSITFLLENSSPTYNLIEKLDTVQALFLKHSDSLNFAYADYRKTRATYYKYQRQARLLLKEFEKAYEVLLMSYDNHPSEQLFLYNLVQANFQSRNVLKGFEYFYKLIDLAVLNENMFYLLGSYQAAANITKFYNPSLASLLFEYVDFLVDFYNQSDFTNNTFYFLSLGSGYTANGQYSLALQTYLKGLQVMKNNQPKDNDFSSSLYYYIGVSYKHLGNYDLAISYLDTAAKIELEKSRVSKVDYYRILSLIGSSLNSLKKFDEALVINKEVMDFNINYYGKSNTYFTPQSISEYSKSFIGLGNLELALEYAHKSICYFIESNDTTDFFNPLGLPKSISNNISYLTFEYAYWVKILALKEMYSQSKEPELIKIIIEHFEQLNKIVDLNASIVQTVEGLSQLSFRYKSFIDSFLDFLPIEVLGAQDIEKIYCLIAKSKAYSILVEEFQNKDFRVNFETNKNYLRKKELKNEKLLISAIRDANIYKKKFSELVDLELESYISFVKNPIKSTEISLENLNNFKSDNIFSKVNNEEIVLDYFVTKKSIFLFAITTESIKLKKQSINELFDTNCNLLFRSIKLAESARFQKISESLYDFLLSEDLIKNKKIITIIPDEKLYVIPFEVLSKRKSFLAQNFEIKYRYNSHVFRRVESKTNNRLRVLAFAPGFESNHQFEFSESIRELYLDYFDDLLLKHTSNLASLPASIDEVFAISKILKNKDIEVKIFTNEEANKKSFLEGSVNADILHIATHGFADMKRPEYSGLLMYGTSELGVDNIVLLAEISNLNLSADLVVLSACKSGYGSIVKGDGIMAMSRGFISAGANYVLASLWKVHDEKTKEFMEKFYFYISEGNSYSKSLQLTKKHFIGKKWLPKDWAGFILIEA